MGTSIILLLLLLICPVYSLKKTLESSGNITVYIGQPFEIQLKKKPHDSITFTDASDNTAGLPSWIVWENDTLKGVARAEDAGALFLIVNVNGKPNGNTVDIYVTDETNNPCGKDKSVWFEIDFEGSYTTSELIKMVARTSELFHRSWDDIRVYTAEYLKEVRSRKLFFENTLFKPQSTVITFLLSCSRLVDDDVVENVATSTHFSDGNKLSSPSGYQAVTGLVLQRKQRHPGREPGSIQSGFSGIGNTGVPLLEQTTSQPVILKVTRLSVVDDKKPSVVLQLETVKCERGALCEVSIPENMFNDEDGTTSSLHLSVFPVGSNSSDKWLDNKVKNLKIRGIPLKSGNFTFRLDARDSKSQLASTAFTFDIAEPKYPYSHEFIFDTATPYDTLIEPKERLIFYDKLSRLVKKLSSIDPGKPVILKSIEKQSDNKARVAWVFPTQGTECPVEFLKMRTREIIQGKKPSSEVHNFMSSKFSIRGAQFHLSDDCERVSEKARTTGNRNANKTTASEPADILAASEPTTTVSAFPILVPLAAVTVLVLLLLICFTTLCILKRKNPKTAQSEYVSKGYPVLLLGELSQEEETPNASTPMLVKEERPPLVISQHENPLYKPPPPLSAASSPRQHNLQLSTRMAPPYVPP